MQGDTHFRQSDPISEEEAGKQSRRDQSHVCPVSSLECLYHRYCTEDDRCNPHQYDTQIFKVCVIMEHVPIESCSEPKQQKGRNQIHSNSLKLFHYSARPSSKRAGFFAYYAISRIGLLPEIPLEQASERLAVTGFIYSGQKKPNLLANGSSMKPSSLLLTWSHSVQKGIRLIYSYLPCSHLLGIRE